MLANLLSRLNRKTVRRLSASGKVLHRIALPRQQSELLLYQIFTSFKINLHHSLDVINLHHFSLTIHTFVVCYHKLEFKQIMNYAQFDKYERKNISLALNQTFLHLIIAFKYHYKSEAFECIVQFISGYYSLLDIH